MEIEDWELEIAHAGGERLPCFRFTFGRVADGEERLGLPIVGQGEGLAHDVGAEEGGTHPAGAQPQRMSGQEQVLGSQGRTLHGHKPFVALACRVGVTVHIGHAQANEDEQRGLGDPLVRAVDVGGNDVGRDVVGLEVGLQLLAHGGGQVLFGYGRFNHSKTPRLPVMG